MNLAQEIALEREAFDKKTDEEIYLEWFNDWLLVSSMAKYYNKPEEKIMAAIIRGRQAHYKKNPDIKFPERKIVS